MSKQEWYADGLSFECTQCGNCCTGPEGYVWFTAEEGRAIAEHLKLSVDEFRRRFARREYGKWTLEEVPRQGRFDCVFLRRDAEGKALCTIYPVRPVQCRTWPFWPSNLQSPTAWRQSASGCPGMKNGGTFYPIEKIRVILNSNNDDV
ncbi:YkgJ family cysteine cluster protein [Phycisphaerales bacterium AB-hyl4]|uniref:YkgJ family cysteine cluster protein n=1 Tax=Natronomicrosphaera hydrolytica TaxID=3242702 RepID=A0ABV4U3U7_9BACT